MPGLVACSLLSVSVAGIVLAVRWLAPVGALVGFLWTCLAIEARLADRLEAPPEGREVSVSGWVDGFPRHSEQQAAFSFRLASPAAGVPSRLRLTWYEPEARIEPGSAWRLTVRLKTPHGLLNPGGFDFERWLFLEGYGASGYVRDAAAWTDAPVTLGRWWLKVRARLERRIGEAIADPSGAALVTALTIGERHAFSDAHWSGLRRTGTSHLVAISGLHVGLVSALVFFLVRRLWLHLPAAAAVFDIEVAAAMSFMSAAVYAALAGFSLPTQRALIMLMIALLGLSLRRSIPMPAGMSVALLFVILWDPFAAVSASFWLSFMAVALLWQLGEVRVVNAGTSPRLRRAIGRLVGVQWGLSVGLMPFVVMFFHELSLIAPLVNLVAIPTFSFVLIPMAFIASLSSIVEPLGEIMLALAGALAAQLWAGLELAARSPWAAMSVPQLHPAWMSMMLAGAAAVLPGHPLPGRYLGWIAVIAVLTRPAPRPDDAGLRMTMLDVGHGLAVVLRTRDHALLYDTGARYRSGFDSGAELVLPALRAMGIAALDAIVVSHADNDHAGGLAAVVEMFPDARVIAGPDVAWPGSAVCERGHSWLWDGVGFDVLHPHRDDPALGNDSSCVLRISAGGRTVLITGDIEARAERALAAEVPGLRADVVVVPHHGSATSSTAALTATVRPSLALVSAAYGNRWGFPKPTVRAAWEDAGARVLVTSTSGAITVELEPSGSITLETLRSRRYWRAAAL